MTLSSDPLGLTPAQRQKSDLEEMLLGSLFRTDQMTGIRNEPGIRITLACFHCRQIDNHDGEPCPYVIDSE